jgi:hypothetical protein
MVTYGKEPGITVCRQIAGPAKTFEKRITAGQDKSGMSEAEGIAEVIGGRVLYRGSADRVNPGRPG